MKKFAVLFLLLLAAPCYAQISVGNGSGGVVPPASITGYPSDQSKVLRGDGSWGTPTATAGANQPMRWAPAITATPTADQNWSVQLIDNVTFPENFSGSLPDGTSGGSCDTNPSEVDAYRLRCSTTDIGSVVISTAGAFNFQTGKRPYIRASTTATPGTNGGSITVPTGTTNGDLMLLIVAGNPVCDAALVTGDGTWTLPTNGSKKQGAGGYSCVYAKIANAEVNPSCCGANSFPGMILMDIPNVPGTVGAAVEAVTNNGANSTTPRILALAGPLGSSQDLFVGHIGTLQNDGTHTLSTAPPGLIQVASINYCAGTNYANWVGQVSLTATSTGNFDGTLAVGTDWSTFAIAIAPATNGGTASCNNNPLQLIAPHTVSGFCRMTFGGHAPTS